MTDPTDHREPFFSAAEFAEMKLVGLPKTKRGVNELIRREEMEKRHDVNGRPLWRRNGSGRVWSWQILDGAARRDFLRRRAKETLRRIPNKDPAPEKLGTGEAWRWFEGLSEKKKDHARERLRAIEAVEGLRRAGMAKHDAVTTVAKQTGTAPSVLWSWFRLIARLPAEDRLPALAPRQAGRQSRVECDARAWDFLKADYLRNAKPSFTSCYRRLQAAAAEHGWTIPSGRTLERRLDTEIPEAVRVLARDGEDALKRMYPAQERDRTELHALEAVNLDGHIWDVFVRWPDGTVGRPVMVAIQDLYSNKMLAWRIDRTENADTVRLAFADLFRRYGIPDRAYMDNGRGFASKFITGGTPNRYRFKVKAEEPAGILTALGIEVHWTKPYSGQSKPIERAFRDFCDAIAKHPAFEGAYTGNNPMAKPENYGSRAIPIEEFVDVVGQWIGHHNARPGRNTRVCQRRLSFDQAFEASYARALIRRATEEQLRMCLLAAESVRADRRSGEIRLLGNRYWAECLHDMRGHPVTVRFDPDNLHDGISVYRLDGVFVGTAPCIERAGFGDTGAARDHARARNQFIKATRAAAAAERRMTLDEVARLLPRIDEDEPAAPKTVRPLFNGAAALNAQPAADTETDEQEDGEVLFFQQLGKALDLKEAQDE